MSTRGTYKRDDLEFARAVTFFDAIFAFAVTLLITTVDDFSPEAWSSFQALKETNGSSLLAFAISFVVVVSFWRANHQEVTGFTALDGRLIFLNCAVMFGVVLIPFATEALGKLDDLPLPVAVYAIVISGTYILQHVVVFVADQRGLRATKMTSRERIWALIDTVILPLVFRLHSTGLFGLPAGRRAVLDQPGRDHAGGAVGWKRSAEPGAGRLRRRSPRRK